MKTALLLVSRTIAFLAQFAAALAVASLVFTPSALAQSQGSVKVLNDQAREQLALKIQKNVRISVFEYRKDADAYVVKIEAEPDVGPNTTTVDWLLKAIDNGTSEKELRRNPSKIVGSLYRLKNDLWLLSDEEIEARKSAKAAKK